jgi:hypothetical protein
MKLPELDMQEPIIQFLTQTGKAMALLIGSGGFTFLSQSIPDEAGLAKIASSLTGWGLAIACIWVLVKAVLILFAKMEEKDKIIALLHEQALEKAERQRDEAERELQLKSEKLETSRLQQP